MKINKDENIILKKSRLNYGVFFPFPKERGLMSDWTYGGGASLKYRFGFVNIHLTNQRVYAEFMLLHKCIVDIPFSQIENFKKEKRGFSDVLVIDYLKNNKKQCVILNVGKDTDSWLKKLSESIKKSRG